MTAYIIEGDILNIIFGSYSTPIDKVVYLPAPPTSPVGPEGSLKQLLKDISDSVDRHFMDTVIDVLIKEGYK